MEHASATAPATSERPSPTPSPPPSALRPFAAILRFGTVHRPLSTGRGTASPSVLLLLLLLAAPFAHAQADTATAPSSDSAATDPNYVLIIGDTIQVTVLGEPELATVQLLDRDGRVRLNLLEELELQNLTVRAAEEAIAKAYVDAELLRKPDVRIQVTAYAGRYITLLGAVVKRGRIRFPKDTQTMDLIDVINESGGLLPIARGEQLTVTRTDADGKETIEVVNFDALVSGRGPRGQRPAPVLLRPGDRVFVPERLF